MGTTSDTTSQRQFVIQMNEALRSRTGIVGPKRPRTDRDSGRKACWMIRPLMDERTSFTRLHDCVSFGDADDSMTDCGTMPIDNFTHCVNGSNALSQKIPSLMLDGLDDDEDRSPSPSRHRRRSRSPN